MSKRSKQKRGHRRGDSEQAGKAGQRPAPDPRHVALRAVDRIRRFGIDGPRPVDDLGLLFDAGDAAVDAVREALRSVGGNHVVAAVHLVRLLRFRDLSADVVEVALASDASLEAKREALATLAVLADGGRGFEADTGTASGIDSDGVLAVHNERLRVADRFLNAPEVESLRAVLQLPDGWWVPTVGAWLAASRGLSGELLELVLGKRSSIDVLVLDRLGRSDSPDAATVVRRSIGSDDRDVRKAAKRALHQLRARGLDADSTDDGDGFSLKIRADVSHDVQTHATSIDGAGARVIWVLTPSGAGGQRLLEAVIDDHVGLRGAEVMAVTRKGFREHMSQLGDNPAILVHRLPETKVLGWLAAAERATQDAGAEWPSNYGDWRAEYGASLLEGLQPTESNHVSANPATLFGATSDSQLYREIPPAGLSDRRDLLDASVALLGKPYLASWAVLDEAVDAAARQVAELERSQLLVDEEQRKQQIDAAVAKVADVFDGATRDRWRRRLEDTAELLLLDGERDDATAAFAAAVAFSEPGDLYSRHPFVRALVQRSVWISYQRSEREESRQSRGSRVVMP